MSIPGRTLAVKGVFDGHTEYGEELVEGRKREGPLHDPIDG